VYTFAKSYKRARSLENWKWDEVIEINDSSDEDGEDNDNGPNVDSVVLSKNDKDRLCICAEETTPSFEESIILNVKVVYYLSMCCVCVFFFRVSLVLFSGVCFMLRMVWSFGIY